ncbi:unnamed protein product [Porites lobata]|uniref:Ig-like domain-containing protein n=1 Tax=Porites lobata TaxID=104759 RepID=A0ABN8R329_9CNID|nr:unnamed protein product [Porites lobata]
MKTAVFITLWMYCFLSPVSPKVEKARIDKSRSDRVKTTPLGKDATLNCVYTGNPPPKVHWTKDGKKLDTNCKYCVQKVENMDGVSTLRVTPYRDIDFGDYKCRARNRLGFGDITIKLQEDKTKNSTQCQRDRIVARDPRLRLEFLPRCNANGAYHVIQCSIHLDTCWCVDQSGHKIADAVDGRNGKHCGEKPRDMKMVAIIVVIIASVIFLLLCDYICHVTKQKGVINFLMHRTNRRLEYEKLKSKDKASGSKRQEHSVEEPQ